MKSCIYLVSLALISSCSGNTVPVKRKVESEVKEKTKVAQVLQTLDAPAFYTKEDLTSSDTSKLISILKEISVIREVKKFSRFHKDTILFWVMESSVYPSFHGIHVGLDYGDHYSSAYLFMADKTNGEIKIRELVADSLMSIEDWRKSPYYKDQQKGIFKK